MKRLISIITLPLRMLRGCSYTVKEYVLLEIQLQKTEPIKDETLEDLDTPPQVGQNALTIAKVILLFLKGLSQYQITQMMLAVYLVVL